jgi:hypothetical protein
MNIYQKIDPRFISNLPIELVNHIITYTYNIQSKDLLLDIRSYIIDYSILENYYNVEYNGCILLYDLFLFCNKGKFPLTNKFKNSINNHSFDNKIRFLWGLLTPLERTRFINEYIIDDEP